MPSVVLVMMVGVGLVVDMIMIEVLFYEPSSADIDGGCWVGWWVVGDGQFASRWGETEKILSYRISRKYDWALLMSLKKSEASS